MRKLVSASIALGMLCAGIGLTFASPLAGAAEAAGRQHVVTMDNMRYGRIPSDLKVGDTIVWVNRDSVPHTVTARNKAFDIRLNRGQSAKMTLRKAGSFPFYCIMHPAMLGTLTVSN